MDPRLAALIEEAGGEPAVATLLQSVLDRRKSAAALSASAMLEAALNAMTDAVFVSDINGNFILFNDAFTHFHRFPNRDATAVALGDYLSIREFSFADGTVAPPERWPLRRALSGETAEDQLYIIRDTETGEQWLGNYNFAPIRDGAGSIVGSVVVARDVTEEKRAQDELVFQSVLLANVSDAVFVYEFDEPLTGTMLYVNDTAARERGYSREELMQLHIRDLIAPAAAHVYPEGLEALGQDGQFTGQSVHVRKDGTTFPVEIRLRLIELRGRRVVINVSRDMTERNRIDDELHRALAEEQRVAAELIERGAQLEVNLAELADARGIAERELDTSRKLLEAARAVARWTSLADVARELANVLLDATGHRRSVVDLWDPERREILLLSSAGVNRYPTGRRWAIDGLSIAARTAIFERKRFLLDPESLAIEELGQAYQEFGAGLSLYMPLVQRDTVVGLIVIDDPGERRGFTEREIEIVEAIASHAAAAIENARLYDEQRARRRRIEALHGVMETAVSSLDVESAAAKILTYLVDHHGFDMANVWMPHGPMLELVGSVGYPETYRTSFSPMPMNAPYDSVRVYRSGTPVFVNNASFEGNPAVRSMYEVLGLELGTYAVLPLYSRGAVIGTLAFAWHEVRDINDDDVAFYDSIAHELGVVLDNARLYEAEHDIADRLQEALIALPEALPGLEYAHAYHSATETARVGGDFYDLFELSDDSVGIVIGDVAGKGLDAAVLTSVVKNTIRAHANEPGKMPGRILELTNEILYKGTAPDSFVTVFFGILDRKTGTLVYANGGHTTAAIACDDGSIRGLPVTGSVLGAVPRIRVEEESAQLAPSSVLMLYTDGLTEARSDSTLYGETRLFGVLAAHRGEPTSDVLRAVIEDVMLWSGSHLRDDMALLAIKRVLPSAEVQ